MLIKPPSCQGCPLFSLGKGFSEPTGTGSLGVLVVAEALGYNEMLEGRPLVEWAEAGSIFERAVRKAGLDREQLGLWNIIACQPPSNKFEGQAYENGASEHCKVHFDLVVERLRPKVILAMGNSALKHLTGMTGKNRTVSSLRGYVLKSTRYPNLLVVPTYHPSFIRRGASNLFRVLVQDLLRSVEVAQGRGEVYDLDPKPPRGFVLNPREGDLLDFLNLLKANPNLTLAYDIETDRSIKEDESELFKMDSEDGENDEDKDLDQANEEKEKLDKLVAKALSGNLEQIQFSIGLGQALSIPWTERFIPGIKEILSLKHEKLSFNGWKFDQAQLRKVGIEVNGIDHDLMWMWHFSQPDLPAHLQFVASHFGQPYCWKHLSSSDLAFYGAIDVEVLHRIYNKLKPQMEDIKCERSS